MNDTALFIDADNQSARTIGSLFNTLARTGSRIVSATIAGNCDGQHNAPWIKALRTIDPEIEIESIVVPSHPDCADAALILALGQKLRAFCQEQRRAVIVSRDKVLISAAERAHALGCPVAVAYAKSAPPIMNRDLCLPVYRLAFDQPVAASATDPDKIVDYGIRHAIDYIHAHCRRTCRGGFLKTHVCSLLIKLGYATKESREWVLSRIPNLKTQGAPDQMELVF